MLQQVRKRATWLCHWHNCRTDHRWFGQDIGLAHRKTTHTPGRSHYRNGREGIGKTTLAGAVFEDSRIVHDFDVHLWVTVSQEYDVPEILRGHLPGEKKQDETVGKLIELVYKHLYGRRYLIVLDDMWHEEVWDQVQLALPKQERGSHVILTTRPVPVAAYAGCSVDVHKMPFLNEE